MKQHKVGGALPLQLTVLPFFAFEGRPSQIFIVL